MKLRKFTKRKSPITGERYPQCQAVFFGVQCEKPVYADGKCYQHCQALSLPKFFKNKAK